MDEQKEYKTLYHIVYLSITTFMGVLMAIASIVLKWGPAVAYIIGLALVFSWYLHISKVASSNARICIYTIEVALALLYYGSATTSVIDMPVIICLYLVLAAIGTSRAPIYILSMVFPLELLYLCIAGEITLHMPFIFYSRLALGILSIICATGISLFLKKTQKFEAEHMGRLEQALVIAKEDNKKFMESISHELRTPINAVNGMSQILLKKGLSEEIHSAVDSIYKAGRVLSEDIGNILDYSEILTNKLQLSENEYEILSVVNDVSTGFIWYDEYDSIEFAIDVQPDIPTMLYGDENKLRRMLILLLNNAFKNASNGGVYLGISSKVQDYGINMNIDVHSTGKGLTKQEIEETYLSFNTEQNLVKGNYGLDLSLIVVHGIVAKMGGFMKIDSKEGYDTHVHISIPQKVISPRPALVLESAEKYKIVYYFNQDKYSTPLIEEFYNKLVENVRRIVGVEIIEADSLSRLKTIVSTKNITHVFVAEWEYKIDPEYFEELSRKIHTSVFASKRFSTPAGSQVRIFRKPVYMLSVINSLNSMTPGQMEFYHTNIVENASFPNMRALIVDDDALNLRVSREILQEFGIDAQTANSGEGAIERCTFEEFDIIFMDYMMRGMNGIECMKKIHEIRSARYKAIPIIALTANAVSGARDMLLSEGFDDFIPKPIEMSHLVRVLKKFYKGAK